jgi:hypothetical protein
MGGTIAPAGALAEGALVERKSLIGFRAACEQMWGKDGLARVASGLAPDVRERTAGFAPLPKWVQVCDLIAWHHALWDGLAARDERVMTEHMHLTVDRGFGLVKRFLLGMATPRTLAPRVAQLWRDEYSSGQLEANFTESNAVELRLRDHPYVGDPLMRLVIAEVYRYVLSLGRVAHVSKAYGVRDHALVVLLRWQ